ncbi:hypothetical protein D3C78_1584840 [compost metagenome]
MRPAAAVWWLAYQRLTWISSAMPASAARANQATLRWPNGTITAAASSGPMAVPVLPPTWNTDCAKPCWPPDARRAMREASGWKMEDPMPTKAAASSTKPKLGAKASRVRPISVDVMPKGRE